MPTLEQQDLDGRGEMRTHAISRELGRARTALNALVDAAGKWYSEAPSPQGLEAVEQSAAVLRKINRLDGQLAGVKRATVGTRAGGRQPE